MTFACKGIVYRWDFFSIAETPTVVYFDVWRKVAADLYQLVGSNRVLVQGTGLQKYEVPKNERIMVDADYFVGLHYETIDGDGAIPYFDSPNAEALTNVTLPVYFDSPGMSASHPLFDYNDRPTNHSALVADLGRFIYFSFKRPIKKQARTPALVANAQFLTGCGLPPPAVYGRYVLDQGTTEPGDSAHYQCYDNFNRLGPEVAVCQSDSKQWTVAPICQPKGLYLLQTFCFISATFNLFAFPMFPKKRCLQKKEI